MVTWDKTDEIIQPILEIIIQEASPEKVILFGSRATGKSHPESDFDFMVIVKNIQNEREISRRINRALLDHKISYSVDIIVVSDYTFHKHENSPYFVYHQASQEGKIFYER
jgi:predicted nucleotidyltransferase